MAEKLDSGAAFPSLSVKLAGGGEMGLPGDLKARYNIVLFYRGHW